MMQCAKNHSNAQVESRAAHMTKVLERGPIAASDEERPTLEQIEALLRQSASGRTRLVAPDGKQVDLPESLLRALQQMVAFLARDRIVTLIPLSKELTTQQAANLLNVSRPYLIKLLNEKAIPYTMVGTHRRIRYRDLMEYKQRADAEQEQALEDLTRLSEALGLYDE